MTYAELAHFNDYWPPNFGWGGRYDPEAHPEMLVPFTYSGVNFGQVHKYAAGLFSALLDELVPHIEGGLHPGSCWAYSTTDNLPDGTRSFHSFGLAIDVNWNVNHMGTDIPDAHGKWAIPRDVATALARKYGLEWGGNWSGGFHDNMHFEVHLPPAVARTIKPNATKGLTMDKDVAAAFAAINKRLDSLPASLWAQRFADPADPTGKRTYSAATYLVYGNLRAKQALAAAQDAGAAVKNVAVDAAAVAADITGRVKTNLAALFGGHQ